MAVEDNFRFRAKRYFYMNIVFSVNTFLDQNSFPIIIYLPVSGHKCYTDCLIFENWGPSISLLITIVGVKRTHFWGFLFATQKYILRLFSVSKIENSKRNRSPKRNLICALLFWHLGKVRVLKFCSIFWRP